MDSNVKARPNHYEVLGLSPSASDAEIAQAFAREVSVFRPRRIGGVAELGIAYETLRDPAKRRAYDSSIGVGAKPKTAEPAAAWSSGPGFVTASVRRSSDPVPEPKPRAEPALDPKTASFIAETLRRLAEPAPQPAVVEAPRTQAPPRPAPRVERIAPSPLAEPQEWHLDEAEDHSPQGARIAIKIGAVVGAVAIAGALLGWDVGKGEDPQQAEAAVTAPLPKPHAAAPAASQPAAPVSFVAAAQARRAPRVETAVARAKPRPAPSRLAGMEEQLTDASAPAAASQPDENATAPAAVAAPAVATAAALPLPKAVIAHTIERIGYACGEVASTSGGEGGAFTVTCTSGQSYRAAPLGGRYHFRRLGGR